MSIIFAIPVNVAYHLVRWLIVVLTPLFGGPAAAAAIVLFTIGVRLLLAPLSYFAFRGDRARSRLLPQIQELQQRHAKDPERVRREITALYAAEGGGLLSGCLPLLLQVPFFSVMYRLFLSSSVSGAPNTLLRHSLLSASLGSHWLGGAGPFSTQGLVFAALFALLAGAGVLALRAARRATPPASPASPGHPAMPASTASPGASSGALALAGRVVPFAPVLMAAVVPLAAGLYLLTTTAWTLAERSVLRWRFRPGQDRPAPPEKE